MHYGPIGSQALTTVQYSDPIYCQLN